MSPMEKELQTHSSIAPKINLEAEVADSELDEDLKIIFSEPLKSLDGKRLDITPYATAKRFRFIDCNAFIKDRTLQLYETTVLPYEHSTISYVWEGLRADPETLRRDGYFHVDCGFYSDGITPRDDGGPINMKVLEYACHWSLDMSVDYLWLDRLCILQTSKTDKNWQIRQMYDIYKECSECIVLAGGLQRLGSVYDETSWTSRAWTFQESILTWRYAVVLSSDWHSGPIHWMIPEECHWEYVHMLFIDGDRPFNLPEYRPRLMLGRDEIALNTLSRVTEYLAYNDVCGEDEGTISEHDIHQLLLQSIQMRTSSRPVDMVFSLMGLVGVSTLHLECFAANERFHATLALVEAMLRRGSGKTTLLDLPLWKSVDMILGKTKASDTNRPFPSLQELATMIDSKERPGDAAYVANITQWHYMVDLTEELPEACASAAAERIPASQMLQAYHGSETKCVIFEHGRDDEGAIELCRSLDIKGQTCHDELHIQYETSKVSPVVFGWSIRKTTHPSLRFYAFEIGHLLDPGRK